MKYINKKTNLFVLIVSSLLLCIFISCSNLTDGESKSNEVPKTERQITVTGKIFPETGRSANTSFTLTEAHSINIWATQEKSGGEPLSAVAQITGNTYSLKLTQYGDWTIHFYITCVNNDGQESVLVNLSKDLSISKDDSSITLTEPFVINSGYSTVHNGGIRLAFEDETYRIFNMTYSAILRGSETGNENSLKDGGTIYFADDFHDAGLQLDNVAPNSYEVTFCFNDIKGNTLYSCKEIITVLAGFTTDTWIGEEGAHFRKDRYGTTKFVITNDLINSFGTEVVPDTPMLLYSSVWDSEIYVNEYSYSLLEKNNDAPVSQSFSSADKNSFCFDSKGYYYAIAQNSNAEDYTKIYSNNPEFSEINDSMFNFDLGSMLAVDRKTDYLYMFDSSNAELNQLTQDDGTYSYDGTDNRYISAKTYRFSDDENLNDIYGATVFEIYDGIVYFCSRSSLVIVELNNATAGTSEGYYNSTGSVKVEMPELESGVKVADILYQDGNLYIMLKESKFNFGSGVNNFGMTNRGGIIRYSLFTKTFSEPLGWTDGTNGTVLNFGDLAEENEKFLPVYDGYPVYYADRIFDGQGNSSLSAEEEFPVQPASAYTSISGYPVSGEASFKFNTPLLSNIESQFCGPQKFVAIKPKKLVIADSGIAFYTDAEGIWKYKNINRIVTVDLESFSIEANPKESPVNFNEKKTNALYLQASAYEAGMELTGHSSFYNSNGSGSHYDYSGTPYAYAGITNGDD